VELFTVEGNDHLDQGLSFFLILSPERRVGTGKVRGREGGAPAVEYFDDFLSPGIGRFLCNGSVGMEDMEVELSAGFGS
jgi:hypothetical protein